ncbi:MAG: hypothetical protein N3G22_03070 [Candidatus Micrarchaeota archaeon]|nr:hypothetical protein [Candidatus Micrarchaeota archaeon]
MEVPNIYQGNYKLLVIVPILLTVVALSFIPMIKLGVDFKGGVLVVMQAKSPVDEQAVASELAKRGFKVSSIKSLPNPAGYQVEVEVERVESLTQADELKDAFFSLVDEVSRLEADVAATNHSAEATAKYLEGRKKIDSAANGIFKIAKMDENASAYQSTNELKQAVSRTYRKVVDENSDKLREALSELVKYESAKFNEVSASLSAKFLEKAAAVGLYSVIIVSIVVFLIFRTFVPSIAVLVGAAFDLLMALGFMGAFGIPLTLASFAALLMVIGFSLDTNVLLTMRVVKRREGTARQRAYESMKTGTTMSLAIIIAFVCLYVLAIVTHINTYYEISTVALGGLIGDLFCTWLLNAPIVVAYMERKESESEEKPLLPSLFSG